MSEPLRVALVGCGGMGRRHLRAYIALERSPWVRLAAVCDTDEGRREAARAEFERATGRPVAAHPTLAEAAAATGLDGADIAVPTRYHHTAAIEAFGLGLHVQVEKPIALTVRAARAMIEAARAAGLTLAVSENFRRVPANRAIRALLADGAIGRPYWTSSELVLPAEKLHPQGGGEWYRDRAMSGSLVALEMGVHEADLLAYWFGPIERVSALVKTYEAELPAADGGRIQVTSEDTCFARIELAGGVVANVTMTMAGHGAEVGRRLVVGAAGSLSSDIWEAWQGGRMVLDDGASTPLGRLTAEYVEGLDPELRERLLPDGTFDPGDLSLDVADPVRYGVATSIADFARAALEGGRPEVGGEEALAALAGAIALLESSAADRTVAVADVLSGENDLWQAEMDRDLGLDSASDEKENR